MTTQFKILEPRSLTEHIFGGMIISLLSPYASDPRLHTHFLDLNRIPKATITDTEFNIVQQLNLLANGANSSTGAKLFNIGINAVNELYIKLDAEDSVLGGANPPAIYINSLGIVFLNGVQLPIGSTDGFIYKWDTTGLPATLNRPNANLALAGGYTDPTTGAVRYDNIFIGAPVAPALSWNPVEVPAGQPANQQIVNQSVIPGGFSSGFITLAPAPSKLPVVCTISGSFTKTATIDGALINNNSHTYTGVPAATFSSGYTFTCGIVATQWTGAGIINTNVASQDINIPFRGTFPGPCVAFSVTFQFNMTQRDLTTGNPVQFSPYFNFNGITMPATPANLRFINVEVQFKTGRNI